MNRTQQALRIARWLFPMTVSLLSACTTLSTPPAAPGEKIPLKTRQTSLNQIQNWQINGKLAVRTQRDAGSATVDWVQRQNSYTISLIGPMGTNSFKLTGRPGRVVLNTSDGKQLTASSPEDLLAQAWGYHLPVSNMKYWIRGLPVPGSMSNPHYDTYNRLTSLQQQGWNVQFLSYMTSNGMDVPSRISLSSPAMQVKIVVYQWKAG